MLWLEISLRDCSPYNKCYTSNSLPSHYSPLNLDYQLTKVDVEYRRSTGIRSVPEDGIQCFFLCLRHCVTGEHLTRNAVVPFMDCHCLQKQKYIKVHMIILCLNWFLFVEGIFSFWSLRLSCRQSPFSIAFLKTYFFSWGLAHWQHFWTVHPNRSAVQMLKCNTKQQC